MKASSHGCVHLLTDVCGSTTGLEDVLADVVGVRHDKRTIGCAPVLLLVGQSASL